MSLSIWQLVIITGSSFGIGCLLTMMKIPKPPNKPSSQKTTWKFFTIGELKKMLGTYDTSAYNLRLLNKQDPSKAWEPEKILVQLNKDETLPSAFKVTVDAQIIEI